MNSKFNKIDFFLRRVLAKKSIKKITHWFGLDKYIQSNIDSLKLPSGSTVLIHIGKCGGRSLGDGISNAVRNSDVHVVHIKKPIYRKDLKYIIVTRGPISRLNSAFRWRYKLVVSNGSQKNRFEGEYSVLVKYGNLNRLAEALYHTDGTANIIAQQEILKIHHIKENISFYLHELLSRCHPNQIVDVLMQENLNEDIFRVFGYKNQIRRNNNPASEENKALSEAALTNLRKFFIEDYMALIKLYCWKKIKRELILKAI